MGGNKPGLGEGITGALLAPGGSVCPGLCLRRMENGEWEIKVTTPVGK